MKLSHYSSSPLTLSQLSDRTDADLRPHQMKPEGLWVSVDGEDDWPTWCQGERWGLEKYKYQHDVTLVSNVFSGPEVRQGVLLLDDDESIRIFANFYGTKLFPDSTRYEGINWAKVMKDYDGIIIAPYSYNLRMAPGFLWYYGWDCASGCIWNMRAIRSLGEATPIDWTVDSDEKEEEVTQASND